MSCPTASEHSPARAGWSFDSAVYQQTAGRVVAEFALYANQWLGLAKVRIAAMSVIIALTGSYLGGVVPGIALPLSVAIAATALCCVLLNQILERDTDSLMLRTRSRALVSGTVRVRDAVAVSVLCFFCSVCLFQSIGASAAVVWAFTAIVLYAPVYTVLKRLSFLSTFVGAVSGIAPPMLGYVAATGEPGRDLFPLLTFMFLWQYPHFLAISWLNRREYARAGLRMTPVNGRGRSLSGFVSLINALALPVAGVAVSESALTGPVSGAIAAAGSVIYCGLAVWFHRKQTRRSARAVLIFSLWLLPVSFVAFVLERSVLLDQWLL
jgi:protoheme IX farnesyltransferase